MSLTIRLKIVDLIPLADETSVNEVFDPERVDTFYDLSPESRQQSTLSNKATNYGVVRPELLDRLYEAMYHQRLHEPDQNKWQFKIVPWREVVGFEKETSNANRFRIRLKDTSNGEMRMSDAMFDLAIMGTGYERKGHETLLESTRDLLQQGKFAVERNYRVKYRKEAVAEDCGVWLQGCCEDTHGVSLPIPLPLCWMPRVLLTVDCFSSAIRYFRCWPFGAARWSMPYSHHRVSGLNFDAYHD